MSGVRSEVLHGYYEESGNYSSWTGWIILVPVTFLLV